MDESLNMQSLHPNVLQIAAEIAAAYLSNHKLPAEQVPDVIQSIYRSLSALTSIHGKEEKSAVPIRKSVTPDFIICLEDGKKLKMLKRYLRTKHGLTPEEYRTRWGLPSDYPMTAPNYAARRSMLAKKIGLGRKQGRKRKSQ